MANGAICPWDWQNQTAFFSNHIRLAIIVYNITYSALSSPMNIHSTVGGFWVNKVNRAG